MCGRPAGWRVLADRAQFAARLKAAAARFRCRPGWGHIVAAARLQVVLNALVMRRTVLHDLSDLAIRRTTQFSSRPSEIIINSWQHYYIFLIRTTVTVRVRVSVMLRVKG